MRTTDYLIEKYLDSTITNVEKKILNKRMHTNPSLHRELSLRQEINQLAIEDDVFDLRAKLKMASAYGEDKYDNRFVSNRTKRVFYAAATVTGIAFGSWAVITGGENRIKPQSLFHDNFMPYPPINIFRESQNLELDSGFFYALKHYQESNYKEAVIALKRLLELDPGSSIMQFYLGVSYMELENYDKAHKLFDQIIEGNSFFIEQAIWYKGLCFLAQNKPDNAINTLNNLTKYTNPYTDKAKNLVKKLGRG
jgi:tetratricopeptide (TPR) repeat protein